ncbi:hypothetical protein FB451DRAFT_1409849 [Mycena latifolia]|nr:hypothetical protein FB451DRAFT_1409849 [Mycena latifolia]
MNEDQTAVYLFSSIELASPCLIFVVRSGVRTSSSKLLFPQLLSIALSFLHSPQPLNVNIEWIACVLVLSPTCVPETNPSQEITSLHVVPPETLVPPPTLSGGLLPNRTSPIARVPVKILSDIFGATMGAPSPSQYSFEIRASSPTADLPAIAPIGSGPVATLGMVARHWRAVAIATSPVVGLFLHLIRTNQYHEWYLTQSRECLLIVEIEAQRPVAGATDGEREIALLMKHS